MVDPDRLLSLLGRVTARLALLDGYAAAPASELVADRVRMGDLKYTYLTAIEACIDSAQHVVADRGLGVPDSNAGAFRALAGAGLLDDDVAAAMAAAVGFRNVLVHGYAEVDDERVVAHLEHRAELRSFVAAMTALLET